MSKDLVLSADGTVMTEDGVPNNLKLGNAITLGGLTVTGTLGASTSPNRFEVTGALRTAHDALYAYPGDMQSSGTLTGKSATDTGLPRWTLADAATQRIKWVWAVPAAWDSVAVRYAWNKEAAGAGNVKWQFAYRMVYPFSGEDVDASAVTTVDLGAIAVSGTTFGLQYELPGAIAALSTPDGAFGSKPFMLCSLARLGADAADTYAGTVSVAATTLTRIT